MSSQSLVETTNSIGVQLFLKGDLAALSLQEKQQLVLALCEKYELDPLLRPFMILRTGGKESLYATKSVTDQLRARYRLSDRITRTELVDGLYLVEAEVRDPDGRTSTDIGVVPLSPSAPAEERANAMMKAHTKAKRRATLSYAGLTMLDETELDTIPNAVSIDIEPETRQVPARSLKETARQLGGREVRSEPAIEPPVFDDLDTETGEILPKPDPIPDVVLKSPDEFVDFVMQMLRLEAIDKRVLVRALREQGFEGATVRQLLESVVTELPAVLDNAGQFLRDIRDANPQETASAARQLFSPS